MYQQTVYYNYEGAEDGKGQAQKLSEIKYGDIDGDGLKDGPVVADRVYAVRVVQSADIDPISSACSA